MFENYSSGVSTLELINGGRAVIAHRPNVNIKLSENFVQNERVCGKCIHSLSRGDTQIGKAALEIGWDYSEYFVGGSSPSLHTLLLTIKT